jgi:RNA 2',3'-cyclic 3'-phosphodiesterase
MRLFIGIPLAAGTADALIVIVHQLHAKAAPQGLRWSARESWHITLQFVGSAKPEQYDCIAARLRDLRSPHLFIEFGSLGTFDRAGVLYVEVRVTPELTALQQAVTAATAPCGFTPEDRPYHPHITLARRKGKGARELHDLRLQIQQQPKLAGFTADSFVLYESTPTPEGSRYDVRERFSLHR